MWSSFGNCLHSRLNVKWSGSCLMLCSEELRRWFIQQEVDLFRFRFQQESAESRARFMVCNNLNYHPVSVLSFLLLLETSWNMLHWRKLGGQASTVFGHLYAGNINTSRAWIWNPKQELLYKYNHIMHVVCLTPPSSTSTTASTVHAAAIPVAVLSLFHEQCHADRWTGGLTDEQEVLDYYWGVVVLLCFMNSAVLTWTGGSIKKQLCLTLSRG